MSIIRKMWRADTVVIALGAALLVSPTAAVIAQSNVAVSQIEEVFVTAKSESFGNNVVSDSMKLAESPISSINKMINKLPGVSVQEGDTYGFDDWSTTIAVRGFQNSLSEQQIGTTVDGLPNGNSNYGGGTKANRYIDSGNLGTVEVSQGTADISSRSTEALGGTINFVTDDPADESRTRTQIASGEFDAKRYYLRYDTGSLGQDSVLSNTRAWVSISHQEATDWINQSAENERDHVAAKLVSDFSENSKVTAYISWDDTHEDNYQRLFTEEDFSNNSEWDQLTNVWTGTPYVDQVYRQVWSTLRENLFTYVKFDHAVNDSLNVSSAIYYHNNEGRGDWAPPYIADVVDDGSNGNSEVLGTQTANTGASLGRIYFVDAQGNALTPATDCNSSLTFPYGGAGSAYDPLCYGQGAIPVASYRHTHYEKTRTGITGDIDWQTEVGGMDNTVRAGFWYEDATRDEYRDWHKITDARVGPEFDNSPYWIQYDRSYPQDQLKWYIEDSLILEDVTLTFGVKQFLVDLEREDQFGESANVSIDSDSDVLPSAGAVWITPVEGLEVFAGYAENFKAISDQILERPDSNLSSIEPETAENMELGVRYRNDGLFVSATYYDIEFDNRIIFLSAETETGPDYDVGTNGTYFNAGGIDSSGFELTVDYRLTETLSVYTAYTYSDSTYLGTGDNAVDASVGVTPGNTVAGIPEDQLVLALDWTAGNISAGLSTKYTGDRYIRFDNSWKSDAYTTADAYVSFSSTQSYGNIDGWTVDLLVNNVFDKDYLGGIAGQGAWIGAPRTVSLSATIDF